MIHFQFLRRASQECAGSRLRERANLASAPREVDEQDPPVRRAPGDIVLAKQPHPAAAHAAKPAPALDPELTAEVLGVMENLAHHGMTMISVTHEMGFARRVADVVVFMHQGKVWETGPTDELFAHPRTAEFKQFVESEL